MSYKGKEVTVRACGTSAQEQLNKEYQIIDISISNSGFVAYKVTTGNYYDEGAIEHVTTPEDMSYKVVDYEKA